MFIYYYNVFAINKDGKFVVYISLKKIYLNIKASPKSDQGRGIQSQQYVVLVFTHNGLRICQSWQITCSTAVKHLFDLTSVIRDIFYY